MPKPPRLLAVSDRRLLGSMPVSDWAAQLAALGVDALQVRERDLDDRALLELLDATRRAFALPARLLVNRRADLAAIAGADGVHLPAEGLPVAAVRALLPAPALIGRSTHSIAEVTAARDEGADYVLFGPVFATPGKEGILSARGLAGLERVATLGIPVVAIGGVDGSHLASLLAAGACGVAAIRAFADPAAARRLCDAAAGVPA